MAYKFQLGAFRASGSLHVEGGDGSDALYVSGSTRLGDAQADDIEIYAGSTTYLNQSTTTVAGGNATAWAIGGAGGMMFTLDTLRTGAALSASVDTKFVQKITVQDDMIGQKDFFLSGSAYVAQGQKLYLDTDKDSGVFSNGDDDVRLFAGGQKGVKITATTAQLGADSAHAVTIDSRGGDGILKIKDNDADAFKIQDGGSQDYMTFDSQNSGPKVIFNSNVSASLEIESNLFKSQQMTIPYDGTGGAEGHLKLGAGGDMQLAVFSDHAYIMNNTSDKDIVFQIKDGGTNATVAHVDGADSTFDIDAHNGSTKGLALGGTLVTATAAELNLLDGVPAGLSTTEIGYLDGVTSAIQTQIDGKAPVAGVNTIVTVGTLDAGAISSNFGNIDNGTSNITSGGAWKVDVDLSTAPADDQTVSGQAGAITFGAGADAGIGVHSDHLYIENNVDTKGIIFKAHDGTDQAEIVTIDGQGMAIVDDKGVVFGSDDDVSIKYDEATSNTLLFTQNVEGAAMAITYAADQHDDAGDAWAMHIAADGGKKMWMNDIASKGTMVEHFSITPNSTVANSTAAFAGHVTVGHDLSVTGDLTVSGDFVQVDVSKLTVEDPLIELARGQGDSADALDIGFYGKYGVGGTHKYAGLFRDANDSGKFKLFKDTQEDLTSATTVNTGGTGYTAATLVVGTLEGNVTGDLTGTADKVTVSDSSANTAFPLVFHNEASAGTLLDDTGALTYNPSSGVLTAGSFSGPMSLTVDTQANGAINLSNASGKYVIVTDALAADRIATLPAAPSVGDQIDVKLHEAAGYKLRIEKGSTSHRIDGGDSIILESDYAAVKLVYVAANDWRVF